MQYKNLLPGTTVRGSSLFRPTVMSIAMADAGVTPEIHLVCDLSATAIVRHRNDNLNQRNSDTLAF